MSIITAGNSLLEIITAELLISDVCIGLGTPTWDFISRVCTHVSTLDFFTKMKSS